MRITIDNIFAGISPSQNFGPKGGYLNGIGIDPDMPATDSDVRASGYIRPTAMSKFSGSTVTAAPLWIVTNPKDTNAYSYDSAGQPYSISSALSVAKLNSGSPLTTSSGNGCEYNDNYIYFGRNTDIDRYGPLDGSPSFTSSYWQGTLGKTALSNKTYPSIRGVQLPNHHMHRHTDNKMYICDVHANNKGILSYISTTKTTVEGDTNNASTYDALDFPYGVWPVCTETYGTDLAVALIEGIQTGIKQKPAVISFWDTTSVSFSKIIQTELPDPFVTAMKNINGILHVWTTNLAGGVRLLVFYSGYTFSEAWYHPDGVAPLAGAVDGEMNRIIWGSYTTDPENSASVFAKGSRVDALGKGVHNILKTTSAGANQIVTCLKYVQMTGFATRQPIVGWRDDSSQGIDKLSTTYGTNVFRTAVQRIGRSFNITNIRLGFSQPMAANMTCTVKAYIDNASSSSTITTLNNTNLPNSERYFQYALNPTIYGVNDFFLEFRFTGTALLTINLPVIIDVEIIDE